MANCVDYAIQQIMYSDIDEYILKLAFENPNANTASWFNVVNETTVEQGIREKVMHRTVLPACNVNGGVTEDLDLGGSKMMSLGNGVLQVTVPEMTTGGRKIISVEEVFLGSMNSSVGQLGVGITADADCGIGVVNEMMGTMINNMTGNRSMPQSYTNCHMTGNNIFVIYGINMGTFNMSATCRLEYDEGMNGIHRNHWEEFAEMSLLATKAHIWRTCRTPTQEAVYRAGVPLDTITDAVNEYKEAWASYKDYLKKTWRECMTWSDKQHVHTAGRMQVARRM